MGQRDWEVDRAVLFPQKISEWIPDEAHMVESIIGFVQELDLVDLGLDKERGRMGRPSLPRKLLLAVWLYGLVKGIQSCRKLEEACKIRVDFMYLTGREVPDHTTLWRFFDTHRASIKDLLRLLIQVLMNLDQLEGTRVLLDGTTMKSAGSRRKVLKRPKAECKYKLLQEELERRVDEMEEGEPVKDGDAPVKDRRKLHEQIRKALEEESKRTEVSSSVSLTDPESRVLRYKEGGSRPGYNVQVAVDDKNGMIVSVDATTDVSDANQLARQVENAAENMGETPAEVVADTGYHSAEEFGRLDNMEVDGYCPPQRNSKNDPNNLFAKDNFTYDKEADEYICPLGYRLTYWRLEKRKKGRRRKEGDRIYRCPLGENCPAFGEYTKNKKGRQLRRAVSEEARQRALNRLNTPKGKDLMVRRRNIEHCFARIKTTKGVTRIFVWGREKTNQLLTLLAVALNLERSSNLIAARGDDPRTTILRATREVMKDYRAQSATGAPCTPFSHPLRALVSVLWALWGLMEPPLDLLED